MRKKRTNRKFIVIAGLVLPVLGWACAAGIDADQPNDQVHAATLENGIRVLHIQFADSENMSIFTFLPLGLTYDGPRSSQWAHMLEHLVINSTGPIDYRQTNAETQPDHMRLDFYGTTENWREGLATHARWLEGAPFSEEVLQREKPRVQSEATNVARNLFTHKFAAAAWAQGYRHGATHAAVNGDVGTATLDALQVYRDRYLAPLDQVLVCTVGGLSANDVLPILTKRLGAIENGCAPMPPVELHRRTHDMTWDLDARHLLMTWEIPDPAHVDFPALTVAAQWLVAAQWANGKGEHAIGRILSGADYSTPEGHHFYISAALRPGVTFDAAIEVFDGMLQDLARTDTGQVSSAMIAQSLAQQLEQIPDPKSLAGNLPSGMTTAQVEANLGLQYASQVYRLASEHRTVIKGLRKVTDADVARVAAQYLTPEKRTVCTLKPDAMP